MGKLVAFELFWISCLLLMIGGAQQGMGLQHAVLPKRQLRIKSGRTSLRNH